MTWPDNSEVLCTAEWVEENLEQFSSDDPEYRLVEIDENPDRYEEWHIPGSVSINWRNDLIAELGGNLVDTDEFETLLGGLGITPETTVVLYGDKANWFAAHGYWLLTYYGHDDVMLLDGGRRRWEQGGYETTTAHEPTYTTREYTVGTVNEGIRAHKEEVAAAIDDERALIDVRNPQEYRGEKPPADIPDTTDREGHIPTADNVPWGNAVNVDGTFKHPEELRHIYREYLDDEMSIAYCRIGERSSITWFVLSELLDTNSANYDGSWTEWEADEQASVETVSGGDD